MKIYKRELYLGKIRPFIDAEPIKVLTGIRRCGKSVMLDLIADELVSMGKPADSILKMDLESRNNWNLRTAESLYDRISEWMSGRTGRAYVFIDEIQNAEGWEMCVRALKNDLDVDLYITGSNSKLLSGELATHISGRYVEIRIYPFSFGEIRCIIDGVPDKELFYQYIEYGGMPLIAADGYDEARSISVLKAMYDSIVVKDISERRGVRNITAMNDVLAFAMSEIGHPTSAPNISNHLKNQKRSVSVDSVLCYLQYAEEAFFLTKAQRYDIRGKELLKLDYKFYVSDLGFREASGMSNRADIEQSLENIVFNELLIRGYDVGIGLSDGKEIDFVARKGKEIEYYQVAYMMSDQNTREREFRSLLSVGDNHPKFILTMDEVDMGRDGIQHMNVVDWLLGSY